MAERLSEPRWLRFTPPGFDAGESGQFRTVRARALKARAETPFPDAFTAEQARTVFACCRRPRERFLVILLHDTGLRIGEALGLRRCDMHLLPDSRSLGCATVGAHVHVGRLIPFCDVGPRAGYAGDLPALSLLGADRRRSRLWRKF